MYEEKTMDEIWKQFSTNERTGLSEEDAKERLRHYGPNLLKEEKKRTLAARLASQLCDSLIFVLFAAAGISILLREYSDAVIILAVVCMNAVVGVIQEGKAERALESLRSMTKLEAVVVRDGKERLIDARELVPGDVVILDAGRQVPADLRLFKTVNTKMEESALTGESVPVSKSSAFVAKRELPVGDRKNMAFMTSYVTAGRAGGVVTATGMNTEIGRIAALIHEAPEEETPLQKRLSDLGRVLSLTAVFLCVLLFVLAVLQKRDVLEMLITAISLAVAAVPEGLPAVVTIVLALSVTRMVKAGTIIRRLPSVETLGAVSVVCSDKTGTLTKNEMTVTNCYFDGKIQEAAGGTGETKKKLMEAFCLCNNAAGEMGEPTEAALLRLAVENGLDPAELNRKKPRQSELPFDSERKRMTTLHRDGKHYISYTKGAPDVILKRCSHVMKNGQVRPLDAGERRQIENAIRELSGRALRVLAGAVAEGGSRPADSGMTFLGLAGMMDPPREEAKQAVEVFRQASVRTVMITGDYADTALAIAKELGIAREPSQCMTGYELDAMEDGELLRRIRSTNVFARVSPDHKVRIVKALKSDGNITAMTGDGVNDAPSLKSADIGIAMGKTGTDVARQASDMILTDDNFATIERAIEEGRGIYENIKKSVIFLLSSNFGEIATMFAAIAAGLASPLKSSHILWINLITDSLPALALGVDKNDGARLMKRPPRKARESLFAGGGWFYTLFYGFLIAALSLAAFFKVPWEIAVQSGRAWSFSAVSELLRDESVLARAQTYAFTVLGLSELFHAVGMRNVDQSVFSMGFRSNPLMAGAFAAGLCLQAAVTEIPFLVKAFGCAALTAGEWGFLLLLSSIPLWAHEILLLLRRLLYFHKRQHNKKKPAKP